MKILKIAGIVVVVVLTIAIALAKANRISPLSWGHNAVNTPLFSNQAINGYDPVAFFTDNNATPGSDEISYSWNNSTWHFASETNRAEFMSNPEKYIPQYGGYCAFAVSKGFTANCKPEYFIIDNGKLYLFSNEEVKKDWEKDKSQHIELADGNWNL